MPPFIALITPLGEGSIPVPPTMPVYPSHPIYIPPGTPPVGGWPNFPYPSQPIYLPPGGITPPPGGGFIPGLHPSHPIYYPPGTYPPGLYPSNPIMLPGMPGWGQMPGVPSHPIVLPPEWTPPPTEPPPISPIPPSEVGNYPSTGIINVYMWIPGVGIVGPIYIPHESVPPMKTK